MILGLDIWVYNFQEVLGSIPSQALFPFLFLSLSFSPKFKSHVSQSSRFKIKEVVYRCLVTAVFTILGNGRVTLSESDSESTFQLEQLSAVLHTDFSLLA